MEEVARVRVGRDTDVSHGVGYLCVAKIGRRHSSTRHRAPCSGCWSPRGTASEDDTKGCVLLQEDRRNRGQAGQYVLVHPFGCPVWPDWSCDLQASEWV